jgi:hypothetical protein
MTSRVVVTGFTDKTKKLLTEIFERANTMHPSREEEAKGTGARKAQSLMTSDLLGVFFNNEFQNPRGFENAQKAKWGGYYIIKALEHGIAPVHDNLGNHVLKDAVISIRATKEELMEALKDVVETFGRHAITLESRVLNLKPPKKTSGISIGDVSDASKQHLKKMLAVQDDLEGYRYSADEKKGLVNFVAAMIGEGDTAAKKSFANDKTARTTLERFGKAFKERPKQGYYNIFERTIKALNLSSQERQAFYDDVSRAFSEAGITLEKKAGTTDLPPM